jgi:hypothetical protein
MPVFRNETEREKKDENETSSGRNCSQDSLKDICEVVFSPATC